MVDPVLADGGPAIAIPFGLELELFPSPPQALSAIDIANAPAIGFTADE